MELKSYINYLLMIRLMIYQWGRSSRMWIIKHQHSHIWVSDAPIESTVSIERIRTQHQKYKILHSTNKKRIHTSSIWNRCHLTWNYFSLMFIRSNNWHIRTIYILLRRFCDHKELETPITRSEMKKMLTLCTKNVHFTYNRKISL